MQEPVGRVHFVVFEKFTCAYLFQIAREKSCDYVLIIYTKNITTTTNFDSVRVFSSFNWLAETDYYLCQIQTFSRPTLSQEALPGGGGRRSHVTRLNFKTSRVGVYKCLSLIVGGGCLLSRFHFTRCHYFLGHFTLAGPLKRIQLRTWILCNHQPVKDNSVYINQQKVSVFKFHLDYESSAFTRSVCKKCTAVLKSGERFK